MKLALVVFLLTVSSSHCADLPQNWVGAGASYNSETSKGAGWFAFATLISQSGMLYSFTTHDVFLESKTRKLQTTVSTGLAAVIRKVGCVTVLGFGNAGVAATSTSFGGAFSGGGVGIIQLGKTHFTVSLSANIMKTSTGGSNPLYQAGFGRTF